MQPVKTMTISKVERRINYESENEWIKCIEKFNLMKKKWMNLSILPPIRYDENEKEYLYLKLNEDGHS
jgi:hypothetical protein